MAVIVEEDDCRIERLELGPFGTNAYIVVCRKTRYSVLIDAPAGPLHLLLQAQIR